jgi:4-hydroxy-3-methylbut-2-enyl diphosphate reductase
VGLSPDAPQILDPNWLPEGPFTLGITAGASTPNNKIGEALLRILTSRGIEVDLSADAQIG